MNRSGNNRFISNFFAVFMMAVLLFAGFPAAGGQAVHAADMSASGAISSDDVNLRKSASTSSKSLGSLKKNTQVTILSEVFTGKTSAAAKKRWYEVSVNGKTGYVRSDLVGSISFGSTAAVTTDDLNYRKGPATTFKKLGTLSAGSSVTLQLKASRKGSSEVWYRAIIGGKTSYVIGSYVNIGGTAASSGSTGSAIATPSPATPTAPTEAELSGKSDLARALLSSPTYGGKARYVATFSTKNCKKLFAVKGYSGISTPQGLAFSGSEYYVLYGTKVGQRIVTYSAAGKRLRATKFAFGIGHPNGITWDPATGLCYVFKGHQKKIYTWHPGSNSFGKSATPDNASGGAYDPETNTICASAKPRMYVYSADGSFSRVKSFSRCNHGISHSAQDCGAAGGFVFHGVSGSNYMKTNFLDVYRLSDGSYLGSIKVSIGEVESAVVGNDGYVQLLINTRGKTDYVWKTPLNVNELK